VGIPSFETHRTLVSVSFFEMPPNKGKNMSSDIPSKYTKRTPLFTKCKMPSKYNKKQL